MSLLRSPSATASNAAGSSTITIAGYDLNFILPGMSIHLGSSTAKVGTGYIISTVTPNGTNGGTVIVEGSNAIAAANTSVGFVVDTHDFNGNASNLLVAQLTKIINAQIRATGAATSLAAGSRQWVLDKDTAGAISRVLYGINGADQFALEQRTIGGTEFLVLRATTDGTTWVDALKVRKTEGGVDFLASSTDLASAATTDLGSVNTLKVDITGTTAITSFGTKPHVLRLIRFAGVLTLTHNATFLILPGGANITTAAGDTAIASSDGSGNWRVRSYQRADGTPLVPSTSLPTLSVSGQATAALGTAAAPAWSFTGDANTGIYSPGADQIGFATGGSLRMTVDSAGNLLPEANTQNLGTFSKRWSGIYGSGLVLQSAGTMQMVLDKGASGNTNQIVSRTAGSNRWTLDYGDAVAESGSNAGSNFTLSRYTDAGAYLGSPLAINRSNGGMTFTTTGGGSSARITLSSSEYITLSVGSGLGVLPATDNVFGMGAASFRWSTIYAGTGTINTSDGTTKTQRGPLNAAEMRAWARVRPVIFQFNDSIAAKGADRARLHAGYIAQDVEAAFRAEGLDPGRYALWCSDPLIASVTKTRTVERARTETVEVEEPAIEMRDGVPVQVSRTRQETRPVTERVQVVDESGAPVPGLFAEVPVMEEFAETWEEMEPTGEVRLGLRYDQCLVFETAYLQSLVAGLQADVAALQAAG